jgi:hypothetical protein
MVGHFASMPQPQRNFARKQWDNVINFTGRSRILTDLQIGKSRR